jgi:hypothetical protein
VIASPTASGERVAGTYEGTLYASENGARIVVTNGSFDATQP